MGKSKICILILSVLLVICVVCGITKYYKFRSEVEQLNSCYEYITKTISDGFDKEYAADRKELFRKVLENDISKSVFVNSDFYNSNVTFSTVAPWVCPKERSDLDIAHCRDLVLAMYLGCVLATEPENLDTEFEWLKDGVWQLDPKPEFMHLMATKYNPSEEDIDCLVNSVIAFSQTLDNSLDKYHTRTFVHTFINDYNENHKSDEYVFANEKKFIQETIEISKSIEKDDFATIWVGYGKVIRYTNIEQSETNKR